MKSWGGGGVSIAIVAIHEQGAKHTQIKHALLLRGLGTPPRNFLKIKCYEIEIESGGFYLITVMLDK